VRSLLSLILPTADNRNRQPCIGISQTPPPPVTVACMSALLDTDTWQGLGAAIPQAQPR
jgi:hypothetical protein